MLSRCAHVDDLTSISKISLWISRLLATTFIVICVPLTVKKFAYDELSS